MNRLIPAALMSLPLVLAACGERDDARRPQLAQSPPTESRVQKPVVADDVKREAKEALSATSEYATQQRREFVAKAERDLAELDAALEDLKRKARTATASSKARMDEALRDLEREQDQMKVQQKLTELKAASADAWQNAKAGFQTALEKLRQSYEKAKEAFA